MKTTRTICTIITVLTVLSLHAQYRTSLPTATFASTRSEMMSSGSSLPMAAVTGTSTTYDTPMMQFSPGGGPRQSGSNPFGDDNIGDIDNPSQPGDAPAPLGDALLPLLLLALGFGFRLHCSRLCKGNR